MKAFSIVKSCAGRDKNSLLAVVGEDEGAVFVVDGKARPIERPKKKNIKHISYTGQSLSEDVFISNKSLRRALKAYKIKEDF
ncbi:MAG: KOW domain-containing RNA-binding protein [Acutalibacteraceae bacterium]|nr:KOW domain-containing RNA-binding protein [Acutalibacteraceae bacterium]